MGHFHMKKILESIYNEYRYKNKVYTEESRISYNTQTLKKSLNKYERKLLLRIQDDNNLIIEKSSIDNFINGVNIGVKLMLEIIYRG